MAASREQVFELRCSVQNYHWGKLGDSSEVASLLASADSSSSIDPATRYAELWMGTHPSGPSIIHIPGHPDRSLADWVKENPTHLGDQVNKTFNGALPYLFKVLSVDKALSIQAHPNKTHAEELHRKDPTRYKDDNHKPEMAVALTDFMALCGFRPIAEVASFIQAIPEFRAVVGAADGDALIAASKSSSESEHDAAMRRCFSNMMLTDKQMITAELHKLVERVKAAVSAGEDVSAYIGDVLLKLDSEFPGDVGGFSIYLLNVLRLRKGEAIYLDANLPHAYLHGDCMECMACSDNVVRAGLTPKFIDTETLIQMLNYRGKPADQNKFQGAEREEQGCHIRQFIPPIKDFAVTEINVPASVKSTSLQAMSSASILICIEGGATVSSKTVSQSIDMKRGTVIFIAANEEAALKVTSGSGLLLYRAHAAC